MCLNLACPSLAESVPSACRAKYWPSARNHVNAPNDGFYLSVFLRAPSLSSQGGLMSAVFGSGNKKEEACDLLTEAANKYKIAKQWEKSGTCHKRVAEVFCACYVCVSE